MSKRTTLFLLLPIVLVTVGCATKKFVLTETGAVEGRMAKQVGDVEGEVKSTQSRLKDQNAKHDREVAQLSKTAQEALDRATAAGKLAEGKFIYETVLTDEKVHFGFDRADLSKEAAAALDEFAATIKAKNQDLYVEIQGHTDNVGPEEYNYRLGLRRAEAVRRYLSMKQGFALHRMSVISYGETEPVTTNVGPQDRARNRRVALVVLK